MTAQLIDWMTVAWQTWENNSRFMVWNLFLALVPLGLSFWLFHKPRSPLLRWGTGLLLGATFLPNAMRVTRQGLYLLRQMSGNYLIWILLVTVILMSLEIWQLQRRESGSRSRSRSVFWWLGFVTFIAFLPNAPYVLTDIIHLIEDIRQGYSVWIITLALVPQYAIFMTLGFEAYVLSLINLERYLTRNGWGKWTPLAEFIIHGLTAIGIYLGRFQRFNSWQIVTDPDALVRSVMNDLIGKRPVLVMVVTFIAIALLYGLCKQLSLAMMHWKENQTQPDPAIAPDSASAESQSP